MLTAKRDIEEDNKAGQAFALLESSGYSERWKSDISHRILNGTADEIDIIIQDLLLNQVDKWCSYRQKDINRRLKLKGC